MCRCTLYYWDLTTWMKFMWTTCVSINISFSWAVCTSPAGSELLKNRAAMTTILFSEFSLLSLPPLSLFCSSFLTLEQFMPLTTFLLLIWLMFWIFILSIAVSNIISLSCFKTFLLSTRMHAHAPSDFLPSFCCYNNRLSLSLSWSLWHIIEDEGRPTFVCLCVEFISPRVNGVS